MLGRFFINPMALNSSKLVKKDSLLKPFARILKRRYEKSILCELEFTNGEKKLKDVVNQHLYYGLHRTETGWIFREKAPNAKSIYIYGDFSYWEIKPEFALNKIGNGDWEIELPFSFLKHGDLYKLWMVWHTGADERLPSHVRRVVQDDKTKIFSAQVWDPPTAYTWKYEAPPRPTHPLIYEAHIGMSSEEEKISTYWEFKEYILPRIKKLGYNAVQLMAIQEHPYYGSFGYQVSNFFAPSSRFGTPEELKELIDTAHSMGIIVILDIVHSHAVLNVKEGLSQFDGTDHLYFHQGVKGYHPIWQSRCFNYGKREVLAFLLSNIKYWIEEFHFDGFRFDGITSMIYWDHGIGVDFLNYEQYFNENVDEDAIVYLTLANKLIKQLNKEAITIAEDVSGMPGMAAPTKDEGIGFDYRMSMGIADFWTKIIKTKKDEEWHVGDIFFKMTDKRNEELTINYAESHDQAMVGDKTIIFQLIDKEMYHAMSIFTPNLQVDRGIALHKLIRLVTLSLASGGYLNFMGNEFGHPEWIDFPREGNNWSYQYARRQWHLADDNTLRYHQLYLFDEAMLHIIKRYDILKGRPQICCQHISDQVLAFYRQNTLFVFNFNPKQSFVDYSISIPEEGEFKIVLNSDLAKFGGFSNMDNKMTYATFADHQSNYLKLYLPARTALALRKKK